ncbi:hypothetical protein ONZ45_g1674 [Pleurotus djamor]|nr:hypothetical protein ONZ45_g1674 [Pleurotus djamor]
MFSVAVRSVARRGQTRSFVSSVLLSKTWQNETVVDLRKEARNRGLSTKGNKASLISRIQEHERLSFSSQLPIQTPVRNATTVATSASEGEAPGKPTPSDATSPSDAESFFKVNIPDAFQPEPEPLIQVPYVPDLWNSEQVTESIESDVEEINEPALPKLVVVGGEVTQLAGGPTHDLVDSVGVDTPFDAHKEPDAVPTTSEPQQASSKTDQGFWGDVAEDIGLPQWTDVKKGFRGFF